MKFPNKLSDRQQMKGSLWPDVALLAVAVVVLLAFAWSIKIDNVAIAVVCGCVLASSVVLGSTVHLVPDDTRSQATERTLRVATNTLEHLRGGLTAENAQAICQLILPETNAEGVAITNTTNVLACLGPFSAAYKPGSPNSRATTEVLKSKRMETFYSMDQEMQRPARFTVGAGQKGNAFGIIVPLVVQDRALGTIKLYYNRDLDMDKTQLAIARGLGQLLSTQLSAYELDYQAELTARAEVKALQAQINPHFLFNTLNTIASLCRTDPMKARDILREFSLFYRRTLESSQSTLIPLSQELEQTRRYLTIEKARFGEDRIVESEHVEGNCGQLLVPSFLVQPIVENAVRHAMRDVGALHVDIHVAVDGDDILVAVADDGLGMTEDVAARLLDPNAGQVVEGDGTKRRGAGMALRNVAERVERVFDLGSGVEIVSKPGEGTCVTLRLVGAKMMLVGDADEDI